MTPTDSFFSKNKNFPLTTKRIGIKEDKDVRLRFHQHLNIGLIPLLDLKYLNY